MTLKNIFANIPKQFDNELFDELLQSENIRIERIVSKGHTSPRSGWYDQHDDEWVLVLKGEATIQFESHQVKLQAGSFINIPAHTRHKVSWTHPDQETIWLAIHY